MVQCIYVFTGTCDPGPTFTATIGALPLVVLIRMKGEMVTAMCVQNKEIEFSVSSHDQSTRRTLTI